ncbi:hypothetical protein NF865_09160 [Thermococcus aggregans]|uniref:Restriction endonuclease n=1 Tax=Thermococcus aggregans TaxID=110163 RepID=A0A9E7MWZ3_THEAG|nr:hypothetical protein [Thermococcus aggregans]USS40458.1 hypothetical protein NF865_09160 [Thermococcus aggregans]
MEITFEKLAEVIFKDIIPKLENNIGVAVFCKERAKFEGWLKVELCESLLKHFPTLIIIPEKDRIDITFDDWAIELKTINTNYRYEDVKNKHRPITKNIQGILEDIEKLRSTDYTNKAILFVVFPATHNHKNWQMHLRKISGSLKDIRYREFKFKNKVPGVIYFGLV